MATHVALPRGNVQARCLCPLDTTPAAASSSLCPVSCQGFRSSREAAEARARETPETREPVEAASDAEAAEGREVGEVREVRETGEAAEALASPFHPHSLGAPCIPDR